MKKFFAIFSVAIMLISCPIEVLANDIPENRLTYSSDDVYLTVNEIAETQQKLMPALLMAKKSSLLVFPHGKLFIWE